MRRRARMEDREQKVRCESESETDMELACLIFFSLSLPEYLCVLLFSNFEAEKWKWYVEFPIRRERSRKGFASAEKEFPFCGVIKSAKQVVSLKSDLMKA